MTDKPIFKGFLKGIFGLKRPDAEPPKTDMPVGPSAVEAVPTPATPKIPKPRSEAYLNRRKGRLRHQGSLGYVKVIIDFLLLKGEATPGEMARALNLPKSTLIYNLNRLLAIHEGEGEYFRTLHANKLLDGKRMVRVGAGKYIRYRIVQDAPPGPKEGEPRG